jgi:adenine-specific DNA-methyltransferase
MQKIDASSAEAQSANLVASNIAQLKALFPELMTEGKDGVAVNVDVLKALVGDATVTDADEKYGLNWHGKRRARQLALTPSTGTLRPCPEESVDWDSTQNLMIEGDNLEVLKLLQKSYNGKVKLIYIDPPYNTGKDFVYPDNFQDNIKNYLELTGQVDGGQKISSNTESSGRFHTDWLNMMYPRLKLARNLLRDDGVIFVSIDDSELANLKQVCDELLGAETFIGRITWERKRKGSHLSQEFVQKTESLLIYSRSAESIRLFGEAAGEDEDQPLIKRTNAHKILELPLGIVETPMSDQDFLPGRYGEGSSSVELMELATIRSGRFVTKVRLKGPFIWTQDNLDYEFGEGARFFIRTMNFSLRALKAPHRQGFKALPSFLSQDIGTNEDALTELASLFKIEEDSVPFDYPKPVRYISKIVSAATHWDRDAICIDFFAGSGTTGHAVMAQNAVDGGNRRYILVQLPEPLAPDNKDQKIAADFCDQLGKPRTIAELTKERLRRAGQRISSEQRAASSEQRAASSEQRAASSEWKTMFRKVPSIRGFACLS